MASVILDACTSFRARAGELDLQDEIEQSICLRAGLEASGEQKLLEVARACDPQRGTRIRARFSPNSPTSTFVEHACFMGALTALTLD